MKNIKLKLAYDGTHFFGWQNNKSKRSVEGELQRALEDVLKHPVILQAASRTDRGVHAHGQIVNFFTAATIDFNSFPHTLNEHLPGDMRILGAEKASDTFHPALDVKAKEYRYVISKGKVLLPFKRAFSWHYPYIISPQKMHDAARLIEGTHDFLGFSNISLDNDPEDTVRTIYSIKIEVHAEEIHIVMKGDHFLYKMARNIAGTLAYIGSGKLAIDVIPEMFSQKNRTLGGMTAPASGLFLDTIYY